MTQDPIAAIAAELEDTREFLELLQQNASDGFALADETGRIIFVNAKTIELTGRPAEASLGHHFIEFTPPEHQAAQAEAFGRLMAGEKSIRLRTEFLKSDGSRIPVEVTASMVELRGRRVAFGIIRDATSQVAYERKIEEDKKFLELLQENANDGIVLTRAGGEMIYVNPRICEIMGRTREQMTGPNFLDVSKPSERERYWAYHQRILAGQKAEIRARETRQDGSEVILDINSSLVERGGEQFVFSIIRDVTAQVQADDRLALYRQIFANSTDGVAIIGLDGRYIEQNEAYRTLLGYSDEDLRGKTPAMHGMGDGYTRSMEILRATGRFRGEILNRTKDGRELVIELSAFAVRNPAGEAACYVGIKRDVTARRKAESELQFQKALLECQSEAAVDGILVVSPDGRMISFNRRFVELWDMGADLRRGHSDEEAIRTVLSKLVDPDQFVARIRHLYDHPEEHSVDELRLKDGRIFDRYSAPVRGSGGVPFGRVWYFRDVTELRRSIEDAKRAYDELKRAQAKLVRSEKLASIGMLVSGVAHQINNPINVIYGNLRLMTDRCAGMGKMAPGLPAEARKIVTAVPRMLEDALSAAEEAKGVLEVFRSFARDARVAEPADLGDCVRQALALAKRWLKGIRVVSRPVKLPPLRCFPGQITQVLLNLVRNAAEAMGGRGRLEIRTLRRGNSVFIDISDTGPGVARGTRRRIFDPFFSTKAEGLGMGLGLTISASIIEHHGGQLTLKSSSARGTTFRIRLPLRS